MNEECPDPQNMFTKLQLECIDYDIQVLMTANFNEAAQFIRTLKKYESRTKTMIEGVSKAMTP